MKSNWKDLEEWRVREGPYATTTGMKMGAFRILLPKSMGGLWINVLASDGSGWAEGGLPGTPWEHVSVSVRGHPDRCPTWEQMCWVKDAFFDPEETVIQLHPPRSTYVNFHGGTLHMWRPVGVDIPLPPPVTVGP